MKNFFVVSLFALAPLLSAPTVSNADDASPSPTAVSTETRVHKRLLSPLARKENKRSKFSRSKMPPARRRVRALDAEPVEDARGRRFVRFEIDEQRGSLQERWTAAVHSGCAYVDGGPIFIKMKQQYRRADMLLGKRRKPAKAGVCEAASTLSRR